MGGNSGKEGGLRMVAEKLSRDAAGPRAKDGSHSGKEGRLRMVAEKLKGGGLKLRSDGPLGGAHPSPPSQTKLSHWRVIDV